MSKNISKPKESNTRYSVRPNGVLQDRVGYLLKRPVVRLSKYVRRSNANFTYQAASCSKPPRVFAKFEWHPGNRIRASASSSTIWRGTTENVVAFYNKRCTSEQSIKECKSAMKWTRLFCRSFVANAVRLQLRALAYNFGNFSRTLAAPEPISDWSITRAVKS
jgi:hypothetical protein